MIDYTTINVSKIGLTLNIQLNRPTIGNSFNTVMRDELFTVFKYLQWDKEIRSVLITAEGDNFCTGADLTEFGTAPSLVKAREIRQERDLWALILNCQIPIITAIQGYCIGSGLELALLGDIRICSIDSIFQMPEPKLGLIPAAGGTQTLTRTMKLGFAKNVLLTGSPITSEDALNFGLVSRVVQTNQIQMEGESIAKDINSKPPEYMNLIKSISSAYLHNHIIDSSDTLSSGTGRD
tara:strand:+ start:105155 stop:105865 length:711 start_codon:yes stop_codon:yes gene_type:complete